MTKKKRKRITTIFAIVAIIGMILSTLSGVALF